MRDQIPKGDILIHKKSSSFDELFYGRDERIRTSDFLHPMQALYQTELRPESRINN